MVTVIYTEPHQYREGAWVIGWTKTQFDRCKSNIFFYGTRRDAQEKIDSYKCKKYKKRIGHR